MNPFDEIPKFCIFHNYERNKETKKYFDQIKLSVEFIKGIDGDKIFNKKIFNSKLSKGMLSSFLSYYFILNYCADRFDYFLLLEDDVRFTDGFKEIFTRNIQDIPDWEIVFLGFYSNDKNPKIISNYIKKYNYPNHAHAILYRKDSAKKFINYITKDRFGYYQIDETLGDFVTNQNISHYEFDPQIAFQKSTTKFSNIWTSTTLCKKYFL